MFDGTIDMKQTIRGGLGEAARGVNEVKAANTGAVQIGDDDVRGGINSVGNRL